MFARLKPLLGIFRAMGPGAIALLSLVATTAKSNLARATPYIGVTDGFSNNNLEGPYTAPHAPLFNPVAGQMAPTWDDWVEEAAAAGVRFSSPCCFDYGNAESDGKDDGAGTMEAIYWGSDTFWTLCGGSGPWLKADLESGMYCGDSKDTPSNTPVTGMSYVTAMLKGPSGNHSTLKAGNAQSGPLAVKWDGARPPGYSPMKKEGAIILGTGGDGSYGGDGTFFEGCITSGNPSDAIDDAVQANIAAAGYGQ
jgi:non-reducing end alpha-L-arabinofuranosidase